MTTLVIAEHDNTALKGATFNTLSAARKIGGDVHILVAGSGSGAAASAAVATWVLSPISAIKNATIVVRKTPPRD